MADKLEVNGYLFFDKIEYNKAKKEQEAIDYICSNTDLNNVVTVQKAYQKLLEKGTFQTIIGYEFLKKLQNIITEGKVVPKKDILPIPVKIREEKKEIKTFDASEAEKKAKRYQELYEKEKTGKISLKIIIGFLAAIIIGILIVTRLTPYTVFTDYEEKIVDQYVEWQAELEEKALQLKEWEEQLEEREKELNQ